MRVGSLVYVRTVQRMTSPLTQGALIGVGWSEDMNKEPESVW